MPKIGLRNIKTAVSVFICLLIYFLLVLILFGIKQNCVSAFKIASQLYTPFFACLATAYSIAADRIHSFQQAKLRLSASVIGGIIGLIVVAIYQSTGHDWPFQHVSATGNPTTDASGFFETGWLGGDAFSAENLNGAFLASFIVPIIITAITVVFVIWFCNLIKRPQCSFIAVLTLCAVMTSLGTNPIIYGPNRILSTIIGILVALLVNLVKLPHYRNKDATLIFSIDGIYVHDQDKINGFNQYKINRLVEDGADVSIFTTRIPSIALKMVGDNVPKSPIICMSGAAVYDFKSEKYLYTENLDNETSHKLAKAFLDLNITPFISTVKDDILYTYTKSLDNEAEELYAANRKNERYISFIIGEAPIDDILYYVLVDKTEKINMLKEKIQSLDVADKLLMLEYDVYDNKEESGYTYLKIYSKKIEELKALKYVTNKKTYSFGLHKYDYILNNNVDYSITTDKAPLDIQNKANEVIHDKNEDHDSIFRKANKIYHTKENK